MGSLLSGYVVTNEPEPRKLSGLGPGVWWELYKHKKQGLWLLSACSGRRERLPPFADFVSSDKFSDPAEALPEAKPFIAAVKAAHKVFLKYELPWLNFSREVSRLLGQGLFGFLSDDDSFATTVTFDSGKLVRLHTG
ncbi:MAG: hypothetical protein ABFD92_04395 [Planctomycetaceae bacterium]